MREVEDQTDHDLEILVKLWIILDMVLFPIFWWITH